LRDPGPAPAIGEHGDEIRAEPLRAAATPAPSSAAGAARGRRPLEGVRILDLMWAIAGPQAMRVLADAGAEVVRVESPRHTDACKSIAPFRNGDFGSPVAFYNYNAGKRMLTLDLATESGREVLLDLVRWADVVCESFTPGVMARFGLDYASLRAVKPDVILLSTCLMGQTGPLSAFAGYGNLAAAITGFASVAGWPDRAPVGAWGAYTDYVAWRYNAIAILAALEHRRRTGEGQHIDLAQAETALHYLAPALLDHAVNGRVQGAHGNDDPQMAPHGVYPAAGDDAWVAIALRDDAEWRALCVAMDRDDLAADPALATLAGRRAARERLDAVVGAWTASRPAVESESLLQSRGVAASVVQDGAQLYEDAQLHGRAHFATLEHATHGATIVESARFLLSETPTRVAGPTPESGADNDHVLTNILRYDEERVTELVVAGAFG
jgi:crotonobetainyl-CoA:carnitine CoA-transferase CaiB-like acyl-CoA transferase